MSELQRLGLAAGTTFDTEDIDAKLVKIKVRGSPHFTGGDLDAIQAHFGKPLDDLNSHEMNAAGAYTYLRRMQMHGLVPPDPPVSWEMANEVALDYVEADMGPTGGGSSPSSPPSAGSGGAPQETSTR